MGARLQILKKLGGPRPPRPLWTVRLWCRWTKYHKTIGDLCPIPVLTPHVPRVIFAQPLLDTLYVSQEKLMYCTVHSCVADLIALLSSCVCVCVIANIGERREAEHVREGFGRKSSRKRTEAKALPAAAGLRDECSVCMTCPTLPSDTHTRPAAASSAGAEAEGRSHGTLNRAARAARRPSGVNTRSPTTKVFDTCILHI